MKPYDCKKCGAKHGMGLEDMKTGISEPLDLCKECLFGTTSYKPLLTPIIFEPDGRNVNMAEELNRLEKELIDETT